MPTIEEYAQLANRVYKRTDENRTPIPDGWLELSWTPDRELTGFSAGVYQSGNDIVIAYTGTNQMKVADFLVGNIPAGSGLPSAQVWEAMELYLEVKRAHPEANITFTGHSLGGGLASMMAVFFDRNATIFDPAPFQAGALLTTALATYAGQMLAYGFSDDAFSTYLNAVGSTFQEREAKVTSYWLEGEALVYLRAIAPTIMSEPGNQIATGVQNGVSSIDLHSMTLLAAMRVSSAFATAVQQSPDLLGLIFDGKLYARATDISVQPNFIDRLYIAQVSDPNTALLDRFGADLLQLASSGGMMSQPDVREALTIAAMEYYYFNSPASATQLFSVESGSISFRFSDIQQNLIALHGPRRLAEAMQPYLSTGEWNAALSKLGIAQAWHVQRGTDDMMAWTSNATVSEDDVAVGGALNDTLDGEGGNDVLIGGAGQDSLTGGDGADVLIGGQGDDTLDGGNGYDTYVLNGQDTIVDSDGIGQVLDGAGRSISGLIQKRADGSFHYVPDATVSVAMNGALSLTWADGTSLVIDSFQDGDLGLHIADTPAVATLTQTISGDLAPFDADSNQAGIQYSYDQLGNIVVDPTQTEANRADSLFDSADNDLILAGGGDDIIYATRGGDDLLEGGRGRDVIRAGSGQDIAIGGEDADVVMGQSGDDAIYASSQMSLEDALDQNDGQVASGLRGDWLDGGDGQDILVGDRDDDALTGGGEADVLIGGGGNDNIMGDEALNTTSLDWSISRSVNVGPNVVQYTRQYNAASTTVSTTGGSDALYGGSGDDWLFGQLGNDLLDGGADNDVLFGDEGNDDLYGGDGNDALSGDEAYNPSDNTTLAGNLHGIDYLDGGAGADTLWGNGGSDDLFGGDGNDVLNGDDATTPGEYHGNDYLDGESGNDTLFGSGGDDELFGGVGDDHLQGDSLSLGGEYQGDDYLDGEAGNDTLLGQGGNDLLYGGDGDDVINGDDDDMAVALHGADEIHGELGKDYIVGGAGNDTIYGDEGDDTLFGEGAAAPDSNGNDALFGGDGNDVLDGQSGNDDLSGGAGADMLFGGTGDDLLDGDADDDTLLGGEGNDYLVGADGNDIIVTEAGNDQAFGGAGIDRLFGFAGSDSLDGGSGNDELQGGNDADTLFGGVGDDLLLGQGSDDFLDGEAGNDELQGGDGTDTLRGGSGNDRLYGLIGNDTLEGGDGIDELQGGDGRDQLLGGAESDVLYGQSGNDTLDGGAGNDVLYGDSGTDTYAFGRGYGKDTITDFDGTYSGYSGTGILRFNADVRAEDVHAYRQGEDLVLSITGTDDAVTIKNHFTATNSTYSPYYGYTYYYGNQVAQIQFADGTIWPGGAIPTYYGGTSANDILSANGKASIFGISSGSDTIYGSSGSDTYLWGVGAGKDKISDTDGSLNTILIDAALSPSDIIVRRAGTDCVLSIKDSPDELIIERGIESFQIRFGSDGTTWNYASLFLAPTDQNDDLRGTLSAEQIDGLGGDDTILGGGGNDTIRGGAGNDVITVGFNGSSTVDGGDGDDRITSTGYSSTMSTLRGGTGNDTLEGANSATDVLIGGAGNDVYGVNTYFGYTASPVQENPDEGIDTVLLGNRGSYTLTDNVENLTLLESAGYASGTGNSLNNVLIGNGGWNQLAGAAGDDTLDGAAGDDSLDGGEGNDIYLFGRGSGQDTITGETASSGTQDTLLLGSDVLPSQVQVSRVGDDLLLSIVGTSDTLRVAGYYINNASVERIHFQADATSWDAASIQARLRAIPSDGNDLLTGADTSEAMNGLGGNDTIYGYGGDDTLDGGSGNDYLAGGTGSDLYVVDSVTDVIVENVDEGTDTVQSSVSHTLNANAENLALTGMGAVSGTGNALDNLLEGNSANNSLIGDAGNDTLDGGAGLDTLTGGTGNDTYLIDSLSDVIAENANEGTDTVRTNLAFTLGANLENLSVTGFNDVNATGNALNNLLSGNAGSNVLDGGVGVDTLQGGAGNDTYVVDNSGDTVIEYAGEGTETVQSSVSYSLSAHVENLTLTGSTAINGTGNALNNVFTGNSANNVLTGGQGDDTYVVTSGDTVIENANEGIDTIQANFTSTLGANVENLTLTGTSRINGTGNTLNNTLIGNTANNSLTGGAGDDRLDGGGGTDTLAGGAGDDYYVIDDSRDSITEITNEGTDTVQSAFTYTLGSNLENLVLAPDLLINGTGNATGNVMTGNAFDNVLDGAAGADTMAGGGGNDSFVVDNAGDVVIENAGEGTDTVQSSVTYVLASNIENLTLTGTAAINATGNGLNNTLTGNSAANVMAGGAGDDVYVVGAGDTVLENAGAGTDTVQSSMTYVLGADIENLTLTGTSAINGTGNSQDNVLAGNTGNNVLSGGAGNDTYIVGSGDTVVENAGEGVDVVQASANFTLGANVENLTLIGTSSINGIGNSLDNVLTGNSAANTLSGGLGNDTYIVGTGDSVVENAAQGIDTVESSVTFTLSANVENLTLTGGAAVNGTGNTLDNTLIGNAANNVLDGGAGNDRLVGGIGDDTYILDSAGDLVFENTGEGIDTVRTSLSFTSGGNIENVALIGTSAIDASGDDGANVLTGNSAANVLNGGAGNDTLDGGGGADTLLGGAGDDTYIWRAGITMVENAGGGADTVQVGMTYTLGDNFENLTLTGIAALNGTGNGFDNVITGNAGTNLLDGGTGKDTLYGADGNDTLLGQAGDALHGGMGDDLYVITGASRISFDTPGATSEVSIYELNDGGIDTVQTDGNVDLYSYYYYNGTYHHIGGVENATLTGSSNTSAWGTDANNILIGNSGDNTLCGRNGDDRLEGGDGDDNLIGAEGVDTLIGGAGNDTLESDYYSTNTTNMYGGVGDDIYILNGATSLISENANEGIDTVFVDWTTNGYTLGANVENLGGFGTLTGNTLNNSIIGSSLVDTLNGLAGDDTLDGGTGADSLIGGTGNDTYFVDNFGDVVSENVNEGTDTVQSALSYTLSANLENLTLTGSAAINGTGNALNNVLTGNSAANVLSGGAGDDTYVVNSLDTIVEGVNEGIDTVQTSSNFTLSANLENLILTGTVAASGTGNTGNNVLSGNVANNVLDGGAGLDTMSGGLGNDTYVVDNASDAVVENAGEGTDTVQALVTYSLAANVENLTLLGTAEINGSGNALNNVLIGNGAANTLSGGAGDDTYANVDALDTIIEGLNEGIDTVNSTVSHSLAANVENLILTGYGTASGTGNSLNNVMTANSGFSTLAGGLGDDTYVLRGGNTTLVENAGEGVDTVQVSFDYTLGANLENLVLTNYAWIGTGNALDNTLTGNNVDNILNGGAGNDTMAGGTGSDTYVVDNGSDLVVENLNEGLDTVESSVTYTLGANLENLTLTGTAAINGTGNALGNILVGNGGANVLAGGMGDDTYTIDYNDTVIEYANEGTDTVQSFVTYVLGDTLEHLTLMGSSAINGTGNAGNNVLIGNYGNNVITGGGGNDYLSGGYSGNDTLLGGLGDDTYVVNTTTVTILEAVGEGTDIVNASSTYTLGANLENLSLTGYSAINGTGNELGNVITGNSAANILAGGAGDDTFVIGSGDSVVEIANEGLDTVLSTATYAMNVNVENLTLIGTSAIDGTGNTLANIMIGNTAANILDGQEGGDTMRGGNGNDTYLVDVTGDTVIELANEGNDTVQSAIDYALGDNVENLDLRYGTAVTGIGNFLNNYLIGSIADNELRGLDGSDTLDGSAGADILIGGVGDDTYVIDNIGDVIVENVVEGIDTVQSMIDYTLGDTLENLTLMGFAAVRGTGNGMGNLIAGSSASNLLDGGIGADTMRGGAGDDIYIVDNTGDIVIENSYEGVDTVQSSVSFTLTADVENLTLAGATAIEGIGNDASNVLIGNGAGNILVAGLGDDWLDGGSGADVMTGGSGNDTYVIDDGGDVVQELADGGADLVLSSVSYVLGSAMENLTLTGVGAITAIGNAQANTLIGNSGSNLLDGGANSDVMIGGAGDDSYVVDNAGDWVGEYAGEGWDNVQSNLAYTLGVNLEGLLLMGIDSVNGTGNGLDNLVIGNGAANTLDGVDGNDALQGDAGNDTLHGGAGTNLLDGGNGSDQLFGGDAGDILVGGGGNDVIETGEGADIVAFNRGSGQDTIRASTGIDNTISLGGGIRLDDLSFRKDGNNLILDSGSGDALVFEDWYTATANQSVLTLQMIESAAADFNPSGGDVLRDNQIETFDFQGLTDRFNQAVAADPGLTSWALTQALAEFHLGGSDIAALGGDLTYKYGTNGSLSGIGVTGAQSVLGNASLGLEAQAFQTPGSLSAGAVKLI